MDSAQLLEWGKQRIDRGLRLDSAVFGSDRKKEIRDAFGSHSNFIKELGVWEEYQAGHFKKRTARTIENGSYKIGKEELLQWAKSRHLKGLQINYNYLDRHKRVKLEQVIREFGSHRAFIEATGIPYADLVRGEICRAKGLAIVEMGYEFENLVGDLLQEKGIPLSKYNSGFKECRPDYIFSPKHWGDAKLSITTDTVKMRKKYLQHCDRLTVFHLIGSKTYIGKLKDGTERVNIFAYLNKQEETLREKYLPLFSRIEQEYKEALA